MRTTRTIITSYEVTAGELELHDSGTNASVDLDYPHMLGFQVRSERHDGLPHYDLERIADKKVRITLELVEYED